LRAFKGGTSLSPTQGTTPNGKPNQNPTMNTNIEQKNNEARKFAIAQIKAVMDAEKAKRAANAKAHLESEKSKW
jgi:hypothetical protein